MPRRSVYFFVKRSQLIPMMLLFDFPEPLVSVGQRATTNIAPQGLALMNSPNIRNKADALAKKIHSEHSRLTDQIRQLFQIVYSRPATATEHANATEYVERLSTGTNEASHQTALADLTHSLLMSNEFLYLN